MLLFDQKDTYLCDSLGVLAIPKDKILTAKASLRTSITLDDCKTILGRKYKICVKRMLPILSFILVHKSSSVLQLSTTFTYNTYIQHLFNTDIDNSNTYLPLSDTFADLSKMANQRNNSRALCDMQSLNIIKIVSDLKHFNDIHHNSISYAYVHSDTCILSLLSLFNIQFRYHYNTIDTNTYLPLSGTFVGNSVSTGIFANSASIDTFANTKVKKHSELYNKYLPKLQYELNRQTVEGEFRYQLKPDKARPYAYFCSSENKHSDDRKCKLDAYFGKDNWHQWDRTASVHNLAYSYNTHQYMNNSQDFYEYLKGSKFISEDERKDYKGVVQNLNFSDVRKFKAFIFNMLDIGNKVCNNETLRPKEYTSYYGRDEENRKRALAIARLSKANTVQEMIDWYKQTRDNYIKAIGGKKLPMDAIFIMEGTVNLATMNDLNEMGYKCVSIYDGFYSNCFDDNLIESIYRKNLTKYIIEV